MMLLQYMYDILVIYHDIYDDVYHVSA